MPTVQGKVLDPSGAGLSGGAIRATLVPDGSVGGVGVTSPTTFDIADDGTVSFSITANDTITPSGTVWHVEIVSEAMPMRKAWTEAWDVASSPDPVDIGAIPRV